MAKAYSYDFRQKVIESIELDGFKKQDASEMFNISRNTINLWFQQKAIPLKSDRYSFLCNIDIYFSTIASLISHNAAH